MSNAKGSKGTQAAIAKAKTEFAEHLQTHLLEEHGLQIGIFEAEELFSMTFREIAPLLYNQALLDARDFFQERFAVIAEDVVQLELEPTKQVKRKP